MQSVGETVGKALVVSPERPAVTMAYRFIDLHQFAKRFKRSKLRFVKTRMAAQRGIAIYKIS
jgi:hypothetical protein